MKKASIMILGISFIICAFMIISNISNLKAQTKDDASIMEQTKKAFGIIEKLLNETNVGTYGLKSPREILGYKPAKPIILNIISLETIRKYQKGEDINNKIVPLNSKRIIPLLNPNNQNSELSIELEKIDDKWEFSSFGKNTLSNSFSANIFKNADKAIPIWIPALKTEAMGYKDDKGLLNIEIISCPDDAKISSFIGKRIGSDEFLMLLKPIANAYNGLPW
jgi:hypothetical protein